MIRGRRTRLTQATVAVVCVAVACVAVLAGCGSDDDATGAGSTVETGQGRSALVSSGTPDGRSSEVLADEWGYTLYVFSKDEPGSGDSACYGRCAKTWQPLTTLGPPKVWQGKPIPVKLLGAIEREDGRLQVTFDGHPLYRFKDDATAGAAGIGKAQFGGRWLVIHPDGRLDDS